MLKTRQALRAELNSVLDTISGTECVSTIYTSNMTIVLESLKTEFKHRFRIGTDYQSYVTILLDDEPFVIYRK